MSVFAHDFIRYSFSLAPCIKTAMHLNDRL